MATCSNMVAKCPNSLISVSHADWQSNEGDLTAPASPSPPMAYVEFMQPGPPTGFAWNDGSAGEYGPFMSKDPKP